MSCVRQRFPVDKQHQILEPGTDEQDLSGALVRGRSIVFRYNYQSVAKSAGRDFRDGAVVPFG